MIFCNQIMNAIENYNEPMYIDLNDYILDILLIRKIYFSVFFSRSWLVVSTQFNIDLDYKEELKLISKSHSELLVLDSCSKPLNLSIRCSIDNKQHYVYPDILRKSTFCLVIRGARLAQPILLEVMAADCIPVIVADGLIMPFQSVIDWKRAAIFILEENLGDIMDVLKGISDDHVIEMQNQVSLS